MKLGFLVLSQEDRRLYIEQAAVRRNVSAVLLEKGFWVCWLLVVLLQSEFADTSCSMQGKHHPKVEPG